ncbi:MAG: cell division ATP-binding protein FtsE [Ruminococcaceae bacterium]|nr:cell division ATP-binding protein FtsE [Oscillospiraceae bacterium]
MIEFRNVYKTYDNGTKALKDFNLFIDEGEFVFIVGSSGAGKSTLLKILMREEVPNSGEVIVDGRRLSTLRHKDIPYYRRSMGMVFQDFRLIPNMTVFDNVAFAMRVTGASTRAVRKKVPYVLGLVGLNDKARCLPKELSGGEQQRVGLARALINNPSMIIADEPTGNVDPRMSFEIVDMLNEINRRGTTILMVTHEHALVKKFRRRIIEIQDGELVADSGPEVEYYGQ